MFATSEGTLCFPDCPLPERGPRRRAAIDWAIDKFDSKVPPSLDLSQQELHQRFRKPCLFIGQI